MRDFEYHSPASLTEAAELLKKHSGARILAGGTDLIPQMYDGKISPEHIVNIKKIPGLTEITHNDSNGLTLGSLVKFNEIIYSNTVQANYPILTEVSKKIASHQIRNLATVGGNLCNAAPSLDSAPILIALDSSVTIVGPGNTKRKLLLEQFFTGPGTTVLERGEILKNIEVPQIKPKTGMAYIKHTTRKALEIAVVGVAGLIQLEKETDKCTSARIVVAACAPTPLRVQKAEELLIGKKISMKDFKAAASLTAETVSPISDIRACDTYRREMVFVQTKRVLEEASSRAYSNSAAES